MVLMARTVAMILLVVLAATVAASEAARVAMVAHLTARMEMAEMRLFMALEVAAGACIIVTLTSIYMMVAVDIKELYIY